MNEAIGIKKIGYTNDGLVFFQVSSRYENQELETFIQFKPEVAESFCTDILKAVALAKEAKVVSN